MADEPRRSEKTKVAIVGGGCAALTAAFELSSSDHFDITVYQLGWRLGGKAASGRNAAHHDRIEEHGLHVWMGFYENAFRLIRSCYADLAKIKNPATKYRRFEDAFFPEHMVGLVDAGASSGVKTWLAHFPPTRDLPGEPLKGEANPFTLRSYLTKSIELLMSLLDSTLFERPSESTAPDRRRRSRARALDKDRFDFSGVTPRLIVDKMSRLLRLGMLCTAGGLLEAMSLIEIACDIKFGLPGEEYIVLEFVNAVAESARNHLENVVATDPEIRAKLDIIELVLASIVGILRDRLLTRPEGLDAINGEDCRKWLARHGASEHACNSAFVRALYNMAFADTPINEHDEPGIAAGQALRGAFRMFFTYRGSLFWKMRGSMGDVVVAPLLGSVSHARASD